MERGEIDEAMKALVRASKIDPRDYEIHRRLAEGHYAKGEHCATNTSDVGCHIATLVISPSTKKGTRSGTKFNHYSLLGTAEQLLRLSKLGQAASSPTMTPVCVQYTTRGSRKANDTDSMAKPALLRASVPLSCSQSVPGFQSVSGVSCTWQMAKVFVPSVARMV